MERRGGGGVAAVSTDDALTQLSPPPSDPQTLRRGIKTDLDYDSYDTSKHDRNLSEATNT